VTLLLTLLAAVGGYAQWDVTRTSDVSSIVTEDSPGIWTYNFTVINTSPAPQSFLNGNDQEIDVWPLIVDYELPLYDPDVVFDVASPDGWSYEFINADDYESIYGEANPFGSEWIIHWQTLELLYAAAPVGLIDSFAVVEYKPIAPVGYNAAFEADYYEDRTDGFIFKSYRAPVNGPYSTSWDDYFRNIGDPPLPGQTVGGDGAPTYDPGGPSTPELSTWLLLACSAFAGLALRRGLKG
jgi:hypothetical protein